MGAEGRVWPFKLFAVLFFVLAQVCYLVLPTHYIFPDVALLPGLTLTAPFYYMIATAASAFTGLSLVAFNMGPGGVTRAGVAYGIAAALAMMALVRITVLAYDTQSYGPWAEVILPEVPALIIAAAAFLRIGMGSWEIGSRLMGVWRSLRTLPVWVQIWVWGPLIVVNMAAFAFAGHPVGLPAALASLYILLANFPILLIERGASRVLSIPHLVPWPPVLLYYGLLVSGRLEAPGFEPGTAIFAFVWIYLVVNVISYAFDLSDTARWIMGDRRIAGA